MNILLFALKDDIIKLNKKFKSTDTHEVHWIPFDKVEEILSYPSLKQTWKNVKSQIKKILQEK